MNKTSCILLTGLFLTFSFPLEAGLKLDGSATAARTSTTAGDTNESATVQIETAAKKKQEEIIGPKTKARIEKLKALKADLVEVKDSAQTAYEDTANNVGDVKDNYEEQINQFKQSEAGTAASLTAEYKSLGKKMEDRKGVLAQELGAKSTAAEQNLQTLHAMYEATENEQSRLELQKEIAVMESELNQYSDFKQQLEDENSSYLDNDSEYKSLKEQRDQVKSRLSEVAMETAALAGAYIKGLLKKDDAQRQAEYNEVIKKNFLLPEEVQNQTNVSRIEKHRREVLLKDIAHAFYVGATNKLKLDKELEEADKYQKNMAASDYKMTAGNLLSEQRIKDIKILYNYTTLMLADLRLKTSQIMEKQDYRLKNYDKNPAVLNLDNYIFSEKDIKTDAGKKDFLEKVTAK